METNTESNRYCDCNITVYRVQPSIFIFYFFVTCEVDCKTTGYQLETAKETELQLSEYK